MDATMRKISMTASAVALILGMAGSAGAATSALTFSDCGDGSCASFSSKVSGDFTDIYTFSVTGPADFDMKAFGLMKAKKESPAPIDGLSISLWRYTSPTSSELVTDNSTTFAKFGLKMESSNLSSGDYFLKLMGSADAKAKYRGEIELAMAPVPEASTWVMLLVGMGLVGLALYRKPESRKELIAA